MKLEVTITFEGTTATITSNDDGMFDLNDIWRDFDLRATQAPSQWRDKVKAHLVSSANLQTINGRGGKTLATLDALYAYAMWVDVKFYMVVVAAFSALTRGDTEEAQRIANMCVDLRESLRATHEETTDQIRVSARSGKLGMHEQHGHTNIMRLICKRATGLNPNEFQKKYGLRPRDAMAFVQNLSAMEISIP
ncbi:MAG: hypothetical protein HLUCCO02_03430 [Idiomarinaceae bacterium HL-53]|nr:MAG: hypothetical protein HLUCCO02_03430 [Idiomarinaceae bacterium HL-53]CUS49068.1 hypothetical protein Ga0003345_2055 [Idiomarinaceae bacterium HL-53]